MTPAIIGIHELPNTRHPAPGATTQTYLADVLSGALADAGLALSDVDGLGMVVFSLDPDKAADLAWRLGVSLQWLDQATHGGASAVNSISKAWRAIQCGDASVVAIVAADVPDPAKARAASAAYNSARRDHLTPIGYSGPNSLFAMLTQRQMAKFGLAKEDYGHMVMSQRKWAAGNPIAVYREPLTMDEYMSAPFVCDPLSRFDCPPTSAGASCIIMADASRCPKTHAAVGIRAVGQSYNYDNQSGDGLRTGLSKASPKMWERAGVRPDDMDLACCYDDYPAMVLAQLNDLGIVKNDDIKGFVRDRIAIGDGRFPVNTSGGLLSAGQAGGAGGMLGPIEVIRQLMYRGGDRQVANARLGVATGYGQVLYRYGSAVAAVVMERLS
jgi:acetyl-CoA acetyltransferase